MNVEHQFYCGTSSRLRFHLLKSFVALLACAWMNISIAQELRTWTSSTGVQAEATFKELRDSEVRLISKDGKLGKFHPLKFSEPDQKYVKEMNAYLIRKNRGEAVTMPVDPRKDATPIDSAPENKQGNDDAFADAIGGEAEAKPSAAEAPKEPLMTFVKRTWKSTKGKSVEGRLHSASGDRVYILDTKNDRILPAPATSLSDKDRDYVTAQLRGLGRNDLLAALSLPKEEPPKPDKPPEQVATAPAPNQPVQNQPIATPIFQAPMPQVDHAPNNQVAVEPGGAFQHRMQTPQFNSGADQMMEQMRAQREQQRAQMEAERQRIAQETQQRLQEFNNRRQANMQAMQNRASQPTIIVTTSKNSAYESGRQFGRIAAIVFMVVVVIGVIAKLTQG